MLAHRLHRIKFWAILHDPFAITFLQQAVAFNPSYDANANDNLPAAQKALAASPANTASPSLPRERAKTR